MRDHATKLFSQYSDLIKPLSKIMGRINLVASAETNYNFSHFDPLSGVCYGISLRYLLAIRNNGIEGGNKYLHWLKKNIELYKDNKDSTQDKLEKILLNSVQEYEILNIIKEIKEIKYAQNFQLERIYKKINYTVLDLEKPIEYRRVLNKKRLNLSHINKVEYNISQITYHLEYIMKFYSEYYAIVAFSEHAIELTYKKYSDNNYRFTLFDSNTEMSEFSSLGSIKEALINKMTCYKPNRKDRREYFIFDEYKKNKSTKYHSGFVE